MSKRINEEGLVALLTLLGQRWREQLERPLTEEEKKRAYAAVDRVLARIAAEGRPSLRERLARWWGVEVDEVRGIGVVPGVAKEGMWIRTGRAHGYHLGAIMVCNDQKLWVSFQTQDPTLAGATLRFLILPRGGEEPLYHGEVSLKEVQGEEVLYEGQAYLGRTADLGLDRDWDLWFAVVHQPALPKILASLTEQILARLADLLQDPDEDVRQAAARAVGRLGPAAATPAILDRLADLLQDPNENVQDAAVEAMLRILSNK